MFFLNRCKFCKIVYQNLCPAELKLPFLRRAQLFFPLIRQYRRRCTLPPKSSTNAKLFKLDSPEFYSIFSPELKRLDAIFKYHGYELRVVGGAVRDLLMGLRPADLDLSTTANPEQMKEMFAIENIRIVNDRGEKHGTVFVRVNDRTNFEITSLRTDVACDGRHAKVEFISDWEQDASRRDLTINALYLGLDGTVYDYVGGYEDLRNKRVLFVGDPIKRIEEDYLRIMRYFRFFGRISDDPHRYDEKTIKAIRENAQGLSCISGERIWFELSKILSGKFKCEIITKMLEINLGQYIGLDKMENLDMNCFSSVCSYDKKYSLRPISIVAALLTTEEQTTKFWERVKFPAFDRDLALFLVYHKCDDCSTSLENRFKSLQYLVACTHISKQVIREYVIELLKFQDDSKLLEKFQSWTLPPFPISTSHIRNLTNLKNMKENSAIRRKLIEKWILSDFKLSPDELINQIPAVLSSKEYKEA